MSSITKRTILRTAFVMAVLGTSTSAIAQIRQFDVPSEDAGTSIPKFARQAQIQVIAPGDRLHGVITPPIRGPYDVFVALDLMLKGTGLKASRSAEGIVTISLPEPLENQERGNMSRALKSSSSILALLSSLLGAATSAHAQAETDSVEQVVVTGSRIANGFQTPTPVTAVRSDDLRAIAPRNLAEGLTQLPVFANSAKTYQTTGGGLGSGSAGQNLLNLRNLNANRVLVLLDGRRVVSTNNTGSVNLDVLPQNLVSRVEVVTGGASAAYGSDAVAGVVNFVLDTRYEGLKAEVQGGISTYGDSQSTQASLTFGHQFSGNLRVIASAEYSRDQGVGILDYQPRDWLRVAPGQVPNPVSGGVPSILVVSDLRSSLGSYGGLISSGPLRGTQFLASGQSAPFQYAAVTGSTYMGGGGGDPQAGFPGNALSPDSTRQTAFVHAEYDLAPDLTTFVELMQAHSHVTIDGALNFGTGTTGQLSIFRDNAYLPADTLARMVTANVQTIPLGRYYREFRPVQNETAIDVKRLSFGARGSIFDQWQWDASYSYGRSKQRLAKNNVINLRNYFAASDAVRTASGSVVCRSTLSGFDPGCVPMNPFGLGSVSSAAADYILGNSVSELKLTQTVVSANLSGDLGPDFQFGAGPISVATGVEYRKEEALQTSDPVSQQVLSLAGLRSGVAPTSLNNRVGPYQFYNPQPFSGSYDIREGYIETGVPLLRDRPFVKSLELNLAARYADYSQSGGVVTWKAGANYEVNDDVRFRYTRSQDIRGPNVVELFNTQTQTTSNVLYNNTTTPAVFVQSGNRNLAPERSTTQTYGVVYTPSWLSGFQWSVDRYEISIQDAIGTLTLQTLIDQCAVGNQLACSQFTVSNGLAQGKLQPLNLSILKTSGWDFEAAYVTGLAEGDLTLRALVNTVTDGYSKAPGGTRILSVGSPSNPRWSGLFSASYTLGPWTGIVSERVIGRTFNDTTRTSTQLQGNYLPIAAYTNISLRYAFDGPGEGAYEAFGTISNLFNSDPIISPKSPSSYNEPVNLAYDTLGRYFTVGIRVKLP